MLKELHDRLLEMKPEGASHEPSDCGVCNGTLVDPELAHEIPEGGTLKTYTEEEYNALLAQVADLETKVNELDSVRHESEVEARIAEAKAQFETQVSDLQAQLDTAVLEAQAAKDEKDGMLAYFDQLKAEEEAAAQIAALREERIGRIKEVASFPDEHIAARADAWAALDEEAFEAVLADWKAIASKAGVTPEVVPTDTAMTASRDTTSQPSGGTLREVLGLRFQGVDTRAV